MPVIYLTTDLMFYSRVVGAARLLGRPLAVVPTAAALIERCTADAVALVLVDLSLPRLDIADLATKLRALPNPPKAIVAYAPHVHEEKHAAATAAGCTEVLSRGQFSGQIERILGQYLAEPNNSL